MLTKPRKVLDQVSEEQYMGSHPWLSVQANRVSKQLTILLDRLTWIRNFLEGHGWNSLTACDCLVLFPLFGRFSLDTTAVTALVTDLAQDMHQS